MKRSKLSLAEKLTLLQRADTLSSIPRACQELGVSTRLYYKIKRQQAENQLELKSVSEKQPLRTPNEVVQRIIELSLLYPESGRVIQAALTTEGIEVSAQTIQKILQRHALGSQEERFNYLTHRIQQESSALSTEQQLFIARFNPAWLEWEQQPPHPGALCILYTHFLGRWPILGKTFLFVAFEAWSGWASALVAHEKIAEWPVQLLEQTLLPLSRQFGFRVKNVLSSDAHEYYTPGLHQFHNFLDTQDIRHSVTTCNGAQSHGYTWHFQQWLEENIIPQWKSVGYLFLDELNEAIQQHLQLYNSNLGKSLWPAYYATFPQEGLAPLEKLMQYQQSKSI